MRRSHARGPGQRKRSPHMCNRHQKPINGGELFQYFPELEIQEFRAVTVAEVRDLKPSVAHLLEIHLPLEIDFAPGELEGNRVDELLLPGFKFHRYQDHRAGRSHYHLWAEDPHAGPNFQIRRSLVHGTTDVREPPIAELMATHFLLATCTTCTTCIH